MIFLLATACYRNGDKRSGLQRCIAMAGLLFLMCSHSHAQQNAGSGNLSNPANPQSPLNPENPRSLNKEMLRQQQDRQSRDAGRNKGADEPSAPDGAEGKDKKGFSAQPSGDKVRESPSNPRHLLAPSPTR